MSLLGFSTLKCATCDKSDVSPFGELVWQEGKGTALRAKGYWCLTCQKPLDNEASIKAIKTKDLEAKIKELQNVR